MRILQIFGKQLILLSILSIAVSSETATIKGMVKDAYTQKPLELVNVYLKGTGYGGATNPQGYYLVSNVPKGNYTMVFSMVGYKVIEKKVSISEENEVVRINTQLFPEPIKMKEVEVTSRRAQFEKDVGVSSIKIGIKEIKKMPTFVQSDLMRILQTMPGVVTVGEFSTALYVRGGNCDQNLVQLDGVTVFNPFHLGGFFSVFEVDAVENAEFIAGGFPVKFGNRLSSVLDVSTKAGSSENFMGTASIGVLYSKLVLEGPLGKGDSRTTPTFLISGRRTYLDKALPIFHAEFPYYFYDIQGKLNFPLSDNTKLSLSGFCSRDLFDFDTLKTNIYFEWDNQAGGLSLSHMFRDGFFNKSYLTRSKFSYNAEVASGLFSVNDSVKEWGIKSNFVYQINKHEVESGIEARRTEFTYKTSFQEGFKYDVYAIPYEIALYLQDKWKLSDKIILQPGIRLNYFWAEYRKGMKEKIKEHFRPAPRVAFKYFLTRDMALKCALGKYFQFVAALNPEENPAPFLMPWAPVFGKYMPQESVHYIIGVEKWISEFSTLNIETYYKSFDHLLTFNEQSDPKEFITEIFHVGNGESYGVDILFKQKIGKISGWFGYSASKAIVAFHNTNYPPNYDRNHNLNLIGEAKLPRNITFSIKFTYGSGTPYTPITGWYKYYYYDKRTNKLKWGLKAVKGPKNSDRFPDYHRIDVGITRNLKWKGLDIDLTLSVINVYNRRNVLLYFYDPSYTPPLPVEIYQIPIIPCAEAYLSFP